MKTTSMKILSIVGLVALAGLNSANAISLPKDLKENKPAERPTEPRIKRGEVITPGEITGGFMGEQVNRGRGSSEGVNEASKGPRDLAISRTVCSDPSVVTTTSSSGANFSTITTTGLIGQTAAGIKAATVQSINMSKSKANFIIDNPATYQAMAKTLTADGSTLADAEAAQGATVFYNLYGQALDTVLSKDPSKVDQIRGCWVSGAGKCNVKLAEQVLSDADDELAVEMKPVYGDELAQEVPACRKAGAYTAATF